MSAAAARSHQPLTIVANAEAACEACASGEVSLVLLDLTTASLDVRELVPRLRAQASQPISIIAYGPHVHEATLAAAREAGCDEVLARGQFDAQLDTILARPA